MDANGPLEPQEALADFRLPPGYRIELVAAEPQIVDPVAIAFDEQGRLWVVDMCDYPLLAKGEKPTSRIRLLEDKDHDGRYETATTFAEGLLFPTGLQPWRGGVIVTLAGEVAYFTDSNNDGQSDHKETWYRGFVTENEQLRANHPQLAADGFIHIAGGLRGGKIENLRQPQAIPISINGRDFAFDPLTGACRAESGNGQFGLTFDDFGRRFTCSNRNPLFNVIIEQRYLERNPKLVFSTVVHDVAVAGDASRIYSRTRAITTSAKHAGQFTAACGVTIFRGDALPAEAIGNAFICEPTANLIHREAIAADGTTFISKPVEQESEFLSSSDEWFRPVNLLNGPDGALYVVDMYRAVIEHPEWVPEDVRDQINRRDGNDRGRIYRIVADTKAGRLPTSFAVEAKKPNELTRLLETANVWQRETAARLILEAADSADLSELRRIATAGERAACRFQAFCLLESLGKLDDETLTKSLSDAEAGVREAAIVLTEKRLDHSPELTGKIVAMAADPDARVRFQVALTLSMIPVESVVPALVSIAQQDAAHEWTRRAIALSARGEVGTVLAEVLQSTGSGRVASSSPEAISTLISELAGAVVATGGTQGIATALAHVTDVDKSTAQTLLLSIAAACDQRNESLESALDLLAKENPAASTAVNGLFESALAAIAQESADDDSRVQTAHLLRFDARSNTGEVLLNLLPKATSPAAQVAIIEALRNRSDEKIPALLLEGFAAHVPTVRRASLDILIARPEWSMALLEAIANGDIAAVDIDAPRAQRLRQHQNADVQKLAEKTLNTGSKDREEVVRRYQAALMLPADAALGQKVFAANCASCHRVGATGIAIGPDIGDSAMKSSKQLLGDILQPNRAIDANFVSYTAITNSGRIYQGIIRAETDSGIILLTADNKTQTILREDIDSLNSGKSLMPEGLEQQVSIEQMANLLAYLKSWRLLDDPKSNKQAAK